LFITNCLSSRSWNRMMSRVWDCYIFSSFIFIKLGTVLMSIINICFYSSLWNCNITTKTGFLVQLKLQNFLICFLFWWLRFLRYSRWYFDFYFLFLFLFCYFLVFWTFSPFFNRLFMIRGFTGIFGSRSDRYLFWFWIWELKYSK
jgi:hypothetical protein